VETNVRDFKNQYKKIKYKYIMARPLKHQTDDERITAYKAQQNKYSRKIWECEICACKLQLGNKSNHFRSKKHRKSLRRGDENVFTENVNTF